ncbi:MULTISPECIES: EAL domain-containing protein [Pseudomonas]|uniref:EAL domain-containing protein n=1 Tax=Pseudomonas sp. CHM02 TaxID=1463662 RepID=UPI000472040A|nr:EAL domain-containing protein [Pseudomonas sp. CHM02]
MAAQVIAPSERALQSLVILASDEHYAHRVITQLSGSHLFQIERIDSLSELMTHLRKQPVDIIVAQIHADHVDSLMLPCCVSDLNASGLLRSIPHILWTAQPQSSLALTPGLLNAGVEQGWTQTLNGVSTAALASHARLAKASGIRVEIAVEQQPEQFLTAISQLANTAHPAPRSPNEEKLEQLLNDDEVVAALATGDGLRVVYQPQYDLATRAVVGAEALIRWHHPRHGDVPPSILIPMINQLGLDLLLFSFIEKTVIDTLGRLSRSGIEIPIAINASARTLCAHGLATRLAQKMHRAGLPCKRLKIELTEDLAPDSELALSASITALRAKGFPVSLDDFGAGAATLSLLARMPFDEMKIDGALVRALGQSAHSSEIISGIVGLAQLFNINLITEGIEDTESIELLSKLGCNTGQGFALARPMESDDFLSMITA